MNGESGLTSEDRLTQEISNVLMNDPATARHPIEVEVQGSTVSLRGEVDQQSTKTTAEQLARRVPGVIEVINELVIAHDREGLFGLGRHDEDTGDDTERTTNVGLFGLAGVGGAGASAGGVGFGAPLAAAALDDSDLKGRDRLPEHDRSDADSEGLDVKG